MNTGENMSYRITDCRLRFTSLDVRLVIILTIVICISSDSALADQFNDQYFLTEGEALDLAHEVPGSSGAPNQNQNQSQSEEEKLLFLESGFEKNEEEAPPQAPVYKFPIESEEDVVEALIAEGAVVVQEGGEEYEMGVETIGGFSVTINGERVRSALKNYVNVDDILQFWRGSKGRSAEKKSGGRLSTGQYYALVAAEIAGMDARLESATISEFRFEIKYKSRGALFAVFPFSFPVRVEVTGSAYTLEERVRIRLPWYRFFIRKYFSGRSLASEIDTIIDRELSYLPRGAENVQAVLLTAVAEFLEQKTRTISDSILLGG